MAISADSFLFLHQIIAQDIRGEHLRPTVKGCLTPAGADSVSGPFVRWQAYLDLSPEEGMDPDPVKLLAATHEVNAYRAERAYRKAVKEAKDTIFESAVSGPRVMDKWDRTY